MKTFKKVLSIAGFDGSGGAGIQADLKTFSAFGCYGMTVLTALPIQNTTGVKNCFAIPPEVVHQQLACIFEDIIPDAIKIGMLFNTEIIEVVSEFLSQNAKNIPIVLDPVMIAKSGDPLLFPEAVSALKERMIPLVQILTPNLPEAEVLLGAKCHDESKMELMAEKLLALGCECVFLKGGHLMGDSSPDLYKDKNGTTKLFREARIITKNNHGTGCTLSAAIASGLALGLSSQRACEVAKRYLHQAMIASQDIILGHGHGPVHHFYPIWPTLEKIVDEK